MVVQRDDGTGAQQRLDPTPLRLVQRRPLAGQPVDVRRQRHDRHLRGRRAQSAQIRVGCGHGCASPVESAVAGVGVSMTVGAGAEPDSRLPAIIAITASGRPPNTGASPPGSPAAYHPMTPTNPAVMDAAAPATVARRQFSAAMSTTARVEAMNCCTISTMVAT